MPPVEVAVHPDEFATLPADRRRVTPERRLSPGLKHPPPPVTGGESRVWPLRVTDLDVLAHVNNAASWAAVEDELGRREPNRLVTRAEMEYRAPVDLDDRVELRTLAGP